MNKLIVFVIYAHYGLIVQNSLCVEEGGECVIVYTRKLVIALKMHTTMNTQKVNALRLPCFHAYSVYIQHTLIVYNNNNANATQICINNK